MGNLGSRFQSPSQGPEEVVEGTTTSRKHGCECKKRKRNAQCDCESEQEDDDSILDTPRRQVKCKKMKETRPMLNIFLSFILFRLTFVFVCPLFFKHEQEEIEKYITLHLSDFVPEWGK